MATVAVLIAGCGGDGLPAAGLPKTGQKALAFAQCMRSHGEPNFPDPAGNGTISLSQIDINAPQYHLAFGACIGLLPPAGYASLQLSAAQQQALMKELLKMAVCMRSHGVPDFPDPTARDVTGGGAGFSMPSQAVGSPNFQSASRACQKVAPGGGS